MTISYSKQVLLKRGNTAVLSTYTGPIGEVTVNTDNLTLAVHSGNIAGGSPVASLENLTTSNIGMKGYVDEQISTAIEGGGSLTVGDGNSTSVDNVTEILINGAITDIGEGTVGISINELVNGDHTLSLDGNGDVTLPDNGGIVFDRANTTIRVGMGFHIASGEGISLEAIDETDPDNLVYKSWYFGSNGGITFPTLTVPISDNATPNGTGQTLKFSDTTQQAIIYGPESTSEFLDAQRIIIQGAPGYTGTTGEGGDIYLWAGPGGSTNGNGGDIKVRAGYGPGTGQGGYLNFQAGDSATGTGGHINIESGQSGTDGSGGDITVLAQDGGEITLRTETSDGTNNWLFDADGSLTFPDGTVQTTAYTGDVGGIATALLHEYADPASISTPTTVVIDGMSYGAGEVVTDSAFGPGSSRVTLYADSMFAMVAVNADINTVYYNGESGSDGDGTKALSNGVSNYRGYYSYHNLISGDDPAIQQIVISKSSTMSGSNRTTDTNNDDFTVTGLAGSDVVIVLNIYWDNQDGPDFTGSTTTAIEEFIDRVMFDNTTERTTASAIRTAFYANSGAIATAIEDYDGDALYTGFIFYQSYQAVTPTGGSGTGAVLELEIDNGGYDSQDVLVPGTGYQVSDTLTVLGTLLGGVTPTNNVTITVDSINGTGGIIGYSVVGDSVTDVWPGSYIIDGDSDQYDIGNFIGTDRTRATAQVTLTYQGVGGGEGGDSGNDIFQILSILSTDKPISEGQWVWFESDNSGAFINWTLSLHGSQLINGGQALTLNANGAVTLPAGGTITEGYVTSNPTIQLTPAGPDVASQKLVIKGGAAGYSVANNGIILNYNDNTAGIGDSVTFNIVDSTTYANQTLYWWTYPEGLGVADANFGTVAIDNNGDGTFSILVDRDDYEFTVRVSPENNNYDPDNLGVESYLINASAPTYPDYHLHLTTGDLTETSIFLGTDDHNVRTTTDGGIEVTTQYSNNPNNVWKFGTDGTTTLPGAITRVVAGTVAKTGVILPTTTGPLGNLSFSPLGSGLGADYSFYTFTLGETSFSVQVVAGHIDGVLQLQTQPILTVGDIIGTIDSGDLGGTPGTTITVSVYSVIQETPTAIDLTKSVNKLTEGEYTLADGIEGQIMYLVPQTGATINGIYIVIENVRILNDMTSPAAIINNPAYYPFSDAGVTWNNNIATLIFTDGAWNVSTGAMDY